MLADHRIQKADVNYLVEIIPTFLVMSLAEIKIMVVDKSWILHQHLD